MLLTASARGAIDRSYDVPLFQAFEEVALTPWIIDEVIAASPKQLEQYRE